MAKKTKERVIPSSGNVFAEWGCRMPTNSTQKPASAPPSAVSSNGVALPRPKLRRCSKSISLRSPPVRYKLEGFSVERLMRFLVALGQDVEIVVKAKAPVPFRPNRGLRRLILRAGIQARRSALPSRCARSLG